MINHEHLDELNIQINELRNLLISTGTSNGLGCSETLKYSEELDKLIIQVQLHNRC
ncbi:aspartyl-phosphate phosphatase Spo0E family protein [Domibacillus aminovorans]|uniref:aspartyl-phosphate phosphatase Spo0E family protein n=1 Tax=Bacillaceae TaxID=186817 RepID=UPI0009DFFBE6|nr:MULTISPECIES: aspartyl-phosphate phosphatase Spo0E family protein [Bacillaceae]